MDDVRLHDDLRGPEPLVAHALAEIVEQSVEQVHTTLIGVVGKQLDAVESLHLPCHVGEMPWGRTTLSGTNPTMTTSSQGRRHGAGRRVRCEVGWSPLEV